MTRNAAMVAAWHALIFAQEPPPPQVVPWLDPRLLWATTSLAAALLGGAIVIALVDRWRKRSTADRLSPNDQLSHFRALYDQGQLSREEFERIRARLSQDLRAALDLPPRTPPAPPTPPPAAGPANGPPDA